MAISACRGALLGALLGFSALCVASSGAQSSPNSSAKKAAKPYALIYGTIYDAQGRHMYGATIKIRRAGSRKVLWELTSDHSGEFAQRVPPGPADYVLWADVGKHSERAADEVDKGPAQNLENGAVHGGQAVKVHISGDERLDLGLHLSK
ncbi:MAG: carboxypeptidase regulatory-like domain-containing protein [Acidobacteria bacterium]|nr:carboxypeptidase regulatory-like domain-containing protein [Acidobacteriota bacterium]